MKISKEFYLRYNRIGESQVTTCRNENIEGNVKGCSKSLFLLPENFGAT
eukprot:UN02668